MPYSSGSSPLRVTLLASLVALLVAALAACGPSSDRMGDDDDTTPDAATTGNDNDGDGYGGSADCNDDNPNVHPGAIESCNGLDDDCANGPDDPFDVDMDGHSTCNGDCDDSDATVFTGAPDVIDGKDNDCDGIPDNHQPNTDDDGDGFSDDQGDCDDAEPFVNPDAVEVQVKMDGTPEGVDNDCDGLIDEPATPCDAGLDPNDPMSYAKAMELCNWVTGASLTVDASPQARSIVGGYGSTYVPRFGASMGVLATGIAAPTPIAPQIGTAFTNTHAHPDPKPDPMDGCGAVDPPTVNDFIELSYDIKVPSNAKAFSFDFNFMSAEYPEWVCTTFDDTFVAYLESSTFTGNVSFDAMGHVVSINVGFFTVCQAGTGCTGDAELVGTGYEGATGGGTGWLTTTAPVVPGENIRLRFMIFDEGDHIYDSAVLLDNFRWEADPVDGPVTVP